MRGRGLGLGIFGILSLIWLSGLAADAPELARNRGVAKSVANEDVDGIGDGTLDAAGDVDSEKGTWEEIDDATGVRARVGTGTAMMGAGEFDRAGVGAGVWIGSDGLREE